MPIISSHDRYRLPLTRRLTAGWRVLPDFIILGAQKAGTTTIYDNLVKNPAVVPCDIKEVHFFDNNWHKGQNWYRAHFATQRQKSAAQQAGRSWLTGEGSPYYMFHPCVPARVKALCPQARLIVVLRNPVERAYSHYQHEKRKGRESLSFEEALAAEDHRLQGKREKLLVDPIYKSFSHQHYSYKTRGHYAEQLAEWFKIFPREQFHIIESHELSHSFTRTFQDLQLFLGLVPADIAEPKRSNVGHYTSMPESTRHALVNYFEPYNQQLFTLLGRTFPW